MMGYRRPKPLSAYVPPPPPIAPTPPPFVAMIRAKGSTSNSKDKGTTSTDSPNAEEGSLVVKKKYKKKIKVPDGVDGPQKQRATGKLGSVGRFDTQEALIDESQNGASARVVAPVDEERRAKLQAISRKYGKAANGTKAVPAVIVEDATGDSSSVVEVEESRAEGAGSTKSRELSREVGVDTTDGDGSTDEEVESPQRAAKPAEPTTKESGGQLNSIALDNPRQEQDTTPRTVPSFSTTPISPSVPAVVAPVVVNYLPHLAPPPSAPSPSVSPVASTSKQGGEYYWCPIQCKTVWSSEPPPPFVPLEKQSSSSYLPYALEYNDSRDHPTYDNPGGYSSPPVVPPVDSRVFGTDTFHFTLDDVYSHHTSTSLEIPISDYICCLCRAHLSPLPSSVPDTTTMIRWNAERDADHFETVIGNPLVPMHMRRCMKLIAQKKLRSILGGLISGEMTDSGGFNLAGRKRQKPKVPAWQLKLNKQAEEAAEEARKAEERRIELEKEKEEADKLEESSEEEEEEESEPEPNRRKSSRVEREKEAAKKAAKALSEKKAAEIVDDPNRRRSGRGRQGRQSLAEVSEQDGESEDEEMEEVEDSVDEDQSKEAVEESVDEEQSKEDLPPPPPPPPTRAAAAKKTKPKRARRKGLAEVTAIALSIMSKLPDYVPADPNRPPSPEIETPEIPTPPPAPAASKKRKNTENPYAIPAKKRGRPSSAAIAKREAAAKLLALQQSDNEDEGNDSSNGTAIAGSVTTVDDGTERGEGRLRKRKTVQGGKIRKIVVVSQGRKMVKRSKRAVHTKSIKDPTNFEGQSFLYNLHRSNSDFPISTVIVHSNPSARFSITHRSSIDAPLSILRPLKTDHQLTPLSSLSIHSFNLPTNAKVPVDGLLAVRYETKSGKVREQNVLLALGNGRMRLSVGVEERFEWGVERGEMRLISRREMEA